MTVANLLGDIGFNLLKPTCMFTVPSAGVTSDSSSTAVDLQLLAGRAWTLALFLGDVTGTNPTLAVQVQECDTSGGSYTSISGATVALTAANENGLVTLLVTGQTKRYARLNYDIGGTDTPTFPLCAAVLAQPRFAGDSGGVSSSPQT